MISSPQKYAQNSNFSFLANIHRNTLKETQTGEFEKKNFFNKNRKKRNGERNIITENFI
jgi:hypothetical protein